MLVDNLQAVPRALCCREEPWDSCEHSLAAYVEREKGRKVRGGGRKVSWEAGIPRGGILKVGNLPF